MTVLHPSTVAEATSMLAQNPDAMLLAGGTDAMVEINDGVRRPAAVIGLDRVTELREWHHDQQRSTVTIGAGVTYTELMGEPIASLLPALAEASRTVGSPQIRNAGTLGGNLATCSPAGDGLPVLCALDAEVVLRSAEGRRTMAVADFMVGVKRTALRPGELISEIVLPVLDGWQGYAKVGVRNAMVIAVASVCLAVDRGTRSVRVALGSVGPTILRCPDAEADLAASLDWDAMRVGEADLARFGALVGEASRPIDDPRSTADYRSHAVTVLAGRLARRATTTERAA
jgi:CO/xanthine dehydrogenase FAD-binding subunit